MRAVEPTVADNAAIQMNDRSVWVSLPQAHTHTRTLFVLADATVGDGVEVVPIHGDTLDGLLGRKTSNLFKRRVGEATLCKRGHRYEGENDDGKSKGPANDREQHFRITVSHWVSLCDVVRREGAIVSCAARTFKNAGKQAL